MFKQLTRVGIQTNERCLFAISLSNLYTRCEARPDSHLWKVFITS